jgi:hypothetical protein
MSAIHLTEFWRNHARNTNHTLDGPAAAGSRAADDRAIRN